MLYGIIFQFCFDDDDDDAPNLQE